MRCLLLLYTLILANNAAARPMEEESYRYENYSPAQLQQQLRLVAYIENFKKNMAEYIRSKYNYLTINEMEKIKAILENFLKNFSDDLRQILNGNKIENFDEKEKIEDGISDDAFEGINQRVKEEFKDISDGTKKEIVYRLRKYLLSTRIQLDKVIEESKRALEANSH